MITEAWTQTQIFEKFASVQNLKELVNSLEGYYWQDGAVICAIWVNNLRINEADEARLGTVAVRDIKSLQVSIGNPQDLVRATCSSLSQSLPQLIQASETMYQQICSGSTAPSALQLAQFLQDLIGVTDALEAIRRPIFQQVPAHKDQWQRIERQWQDVIKELSQAYQLRNLVQMADVLEYDLTECLNQWHALVTSLYQELAPANL